jgi:hypothetical protein
VGVLEDGCACGHDTDGKAMSANLA